MHPSEVIKAQEAAFEQAKRSNPQRTSTQEARPKESIDLTGDSPPPTARVSSASRLPSSSSHSTPSILTPAYHEQQQHHHSSSAPSVAQAHASTSSSPYFSTGKLLYPGFNPHPKGGPGPARVQEPKTFQSRKPSPPPPPRPNSTPSLYVKKLPQVHIGPPQLDGPKYAPAVASYQPRPQYHQNTNQNRPQGGGSSSNALNQQPSNFHQSIPTGPRALQQGGGGNQRYPLPRPAALDIENDSYSQSSPHDSRDRHSQDHNDEFARTRNANRGNRRHSDYHQNQNQHQNSYSPHSNASFNSNNYPSAQSQPLSHSRSYGSQPSQQKPSTPLFNPDEKGSLWGNKQEPESNPHSQQQLPSVAPPPVASTSKTTSITSPNTAVQDDLEEDSEELEIMSPFYITPTDPSAKFDTQQSHHPSSSGFGRNGGFQGAASNGRGNQSRGPKGGTKNVKAAGGGGKFRSDFNADDGDEEVSQYGKKNEKSGLKLFGKAMNAATSEKNTANKGKGVGASGSSDALKSMGRIPKATNGHKRFINSDDEDTQEDKAAQLVQQTLRLRDEHYRVRDSAPAAISVKGAASKVKNVKEKDTKGKGKAKPLEITLSSDDDEVEDEEEGPYGYGAGWANGDDSDPVQDFDDEPKAGPSNPRMSQHQSISSSKSRQDALSSRRNQEGQISSDYDELAMPLIDSLRRTGSRTGNVSSKVDHFEELANGARGGGNGGGAKGKMAKSMGTRGGKNPPPSLDGAGTGLDSFDDMKNSKPSTTSKKQNKSSSKRGGSPNLPAVIDLAIEPYLLAKTAIPTNDPAINYSLKLTTSGAIKTQKITITQRRGSSNPKDIACFKAEDLHECQWMTLPDDKNAINFIFTSKGCKVIGKLADGFVTPEELAGGAHNEFFIISKGPKTPNGSLSWEDSPASPFEMILYCLKRWFVGKDDDFRLVDKGSTYVGIYEQAVDDWENNLGDGARSRLNNRQTSTTNKSSSSSKPSDKKQSIQPQLSFKPGATSTVPSDSFYHKGSSSSTANNNSKRSALQQDEQGDWVQTSTDRRRSTRNSNSVYSENNPQRRAQPPQQDPFPSDHVVLEYPNNGEPGSVTVTYGDKKRLNEDEFLNDTLIEFGLKKAMVEVKEADKNRPDNEKVAPVTHVFNSFFYKKLSSGKQTKEDKEKDIFTPYKLVEKWTKKFKLFEKKYIVIPINEHLHWYLAVIVNPQWIIDNAPTGPPPSNVNVVATRGRTSSANTGEQPMVIDSSSQPPSESTALPEAEPQEPSGTKSKYFRKSSESDEEEEKEAQHEEQEEVIRNKIVEHGKEREMGVAEAEVEGADDDDDITMVDPEVEGGGANSNDGIGGEIMEISDDEEEDQIIDDSQPTAAQAQSHSCTYKKASPPAASTSNGSGPTRVPVPIGAPTKPPKGASSPPPAPPPAAEDIPIDVDATEEEEVSAANLARELGADPTLSDRCYIFTFDSLGGRHDAVVEKLKKYLHMEAKTKVGVEYTAADQVKGIAVRVPQQPNYCDCGLYILHFVEKFLANPSSMTEYIVGRDIPRPSIKGPGEENKRKRTKWTADAARLDAAVTKENMWNEQEALNKRRTMRSQVEQLMKEYEPTRIAKDKKEKEEKAAREKKREERELARSKAEAEGTEEGSTESTEMERKRSREEREVEEQRAAAAEGQVGSPKPQKKGKGKGKKKFVEEITIDDSDEDDDGSVAGSPKKKKDKSPQRPPPAPPVDFAQRSSLASSTSRAKPTSADFLPDHTTSTRQNVPQGPSLVPEYGSDHEEEESGKLDNSQAQAEDARSSSSSSTSETLSDAPPTRSQGRALEEEAQSPPKKRRKTKPTVTPKPPTPPSPLPHESSQRGFAVGSEGEEEEEEEEEDQPDSSIEIRAQVTPELGTEMPPSNQEQQLAIDDALKEKPLPSTSSSSKKNGKKKEKVVDNGNERSSRRSSRGNRNGGEEGPAIMQIDD